MENRYNNNDFERFVKQNADQYRMFPSEKVWKGIHNRLHTRRRWYGLGLALLLLSTGVVTWVMLVVPAKKQPSLVYASPASIEKTKPAAQPEPAAALIVNPQTAIKKVYTHTPFPTASYTGADTETPSTTTGIAASDIAGSEENMLERLVEAEPVVAKVSKPAESVRKQVLTKKTATTASIVPEPAPVVIADNTIIAAAAPAADNNKDIAEEGTKDHPKTNLPTIESVVNAYKKPSNRKKLTWTAYITPTVSYRALNENETFINAARAASSSNTPIPVVTYLPSDLESVVNHKPDIGFQLGFSAGYPLSKKIKVVSGLQFNINKYDIQAYNYSNEVATVALSTAAGRTNTVSTVTNYRIEGGYNKAKWLRNFYFTASVPIGLEVKVAQNKRSYIGFTATAQPTYILDNRSYLVSTDYKNYVEIPSLTRKWNLNTGFEVFAGFKTGSTEWRVGPQVRYQTLSSYKNKYPIEERLFDFGLKLGVVLQ